MFVVSYSCAGCPLVSAQLLAFPILLGFQGSIDAAMLQQELADSIGQLESDLRALDRDASGSVPCREFARALLRNGGSRAQAEALTEQFAAERGECVRYAALLESMRQLAHDMSAPPLARGDAGGAAPHAASFFSDAGARAPATGPAPLWEGNPAKHHPRHGACVSAGDEKGVATFYSAHASPSVHTEAELWAQRPATSHRFAVPRRGSSTASAADRREHRVPPAAGSGSKAGGFVERAVERASSPSYRASSVERMLQTAKRCAFSGSSTPLTSECAHQETSHGARGGRRDSGVARPPSRESAGVREARQAGLEGTAVKRPNTASRATTMNGTSRSFFQDTYFGSAVPPQNTSRVSQATSSSWLAGRGELLSLREIFRILDTDQDGSLSLHELWSAFSHRGIGISLLELDALADSLELDVSRASDVSSTNTGAQASGDRVLNLADFCMLVSRMRSSLIERIRRSELWATAATELSPPPVPPAQTAIDGGREKPGAQRRQSAASGAATPHSPLPLTRPALYDFLSASQSPLSPPSPSPPPAEMAPSPKQQQSLLHAGFNSFSPPPSVHTSAAVSQAVGSSFASSPQGRSTAAAHQRPSGSPVSVSPSPEMEEPLTARAAARLSPPPLSTTVRASEATSLPDKQQDAVFAAAARSQSPHPYDVPTERGLQEEIELSMPPPYPQPAMDCGGVRRMDAQSGLPVASTAYARNAGEATGLVKNDYAILHREIVARQKQRMEEDDFLRRLEKEFEEKYGDLISERSVERLEEQEERPPSAVDHQFAAGETGRSSAILRDAAANSPREARKPRSASPSLGNESPASGGGTDDSRVGGRLLRPTASSRAHEQKKKFAYCPPKRAASWSRVRGAPIQRTGTQVRRGDAPVESTLRRRRLGGGDEPASMSARRHSDGRKPTQQQEQQQQQWQWQRQRQRQRQRSPAAGSAAAHATIMSRSAGEKESRGGERRGVQSLPSPRNGASALMHHYHPGGAADRPSSGRSGRAGPGVVRVSLVASSGGRGRVPGASVDAARGSCEGGVAHAQSHNPPMPGIPPRPPVHTSAVEAHASDADKAGALKLPQEISVKLYGKCSHLLSLCTNYDRLHDGYVSARELGRALYAVAPNLTEGEINDLVRVGIASGGDGSRCHYTSLVGALVVQESYVGFRDEAASDEEAPTKTVGAEGEVSPALPASEPRMKAAAPPATSHRVMGDAEEDTLEQRVRKGRLKMRRLLREELLSACDGDYHQLREAFFAHDDIHTGFLEEKVLRKCLVELFRAAQRVLPPWVMDRCVRLCRTPFEREMAATAADDDNDATDDSRAPRRRKLFAAAAAVVPPPESPEEAAARRRVHGIPKLLWSVLCDYRYLLEELRL
ncbi:calmodulin [Trypanosoma conorhini]|uniref:Calmodulin n=1 Tax=Trypanosoma conorhini TaxID=83891 RepID=A0A3R7M471_9TRYP|nr:calmodulin [Trypanosoma conorhini]RNF26219.1 calmodulin [Trypanosoma conorhini]